MTYLRCPQFLFALLDLRPELSKQDYLKTYWIGYRMNGETQLDHAYIIQWDVEAIEQPTQDEVLQRWEQIKGRYIDPFAGPKTILSVREFRARFTHDEQIAIRTASMTDMEVGIVYDDFQAAQFIDLTDENVAHGVDLYIAKGLIEPSRRDAVLSLELGATPITDGAGAQ